MQGEGGRNVNVQSAPPTNLAGRTIVDEGTFEEYATGPGAPTYGPDFDAVDAGVMSREDPAAGVYVYGDSQGDRPLETWAHEAMHVNGQRGEMPIRKRMLFTARTSNDLAESAHNYFGAMGEKQRKELFEKYGGNGATIFDLAAGWLKDNFEDIARDASSYEEYNYDKKTNPDNRRFFYREDSVPVDTLIRNLDDLELRSVRWTKEVREDPEFQKHEEKHKRVVKKFMDLTTAIRHRSYELAFGEANGGE